MSSEKEFKVLKRYKKDEEDRILERAKKVGNYTWCAVSFQSSIINKAFIEQYKIPSIRCHAVAIIKEKNLSVILAREIKDIEEFKHSLVGERISIGKRSFSIGEFLEESNSTFETSIPPFSNTDKGADFFISQKVVILTFSCSENLLNRRAQTFDELVATNIDFNKKIKRQLLDIDGEFFIPPQSTFLNLKREVEEEKVFWDTP